MNYETLINNPVSPNLEDHIIWKEGDPQIEANMGVNKGLSTWCVLFIYRNAHTGDSGQRVEVQAHNEFEAIFLARNSITDNSYTTISASNQSCPWWNLERYFNTNAFDPDRKGGWCLAEIPKRSTLIIGTWVPPNVTIEGVLTAMAATANGQDPTDTVCVNGQCGQFGNVSNVTILGPGQHPSNPSLLVQTATFRNTTDQPIGGRIAVRWNIPAW